MGSEPRRGDPPPGAADADARHPAGASAFNNGDLAVLVSELHRVRDAEDAEGQSAGEAMTLAATAVRIVEAQLARAGDAGLTPSDLATAREVLQITLEALKAAATRLDPDEAPLDSPRFRRR